MGWFTQSLAMHSIGGHDRSVWQASRDRLCGVFHSFFIGRPITFCWHLYSGSIKCISVMWCVVLSILVDQGVIVEGSASALPGAV